MEGEIFADSLYEVYGLLINKSGKNPSRFVLEMKDKEVEKYF